MDFESLGGAPLVSASGIGSGIGSGIRSGMHRALDRDAARVPQLRRGLRLHAAHFFPGHADLEEPLRVLRTGSMH